MLLLPCVAFFVFGIVLVVLGVHQAVMARDLALDLAASGFLGAVLALGLGAGVLIAGPLADRVSRRGLFVGACLATAAAFFAFEAGMAYPRVILQVALIGVGCGFYETLLNAATVESAGTRATRALAIVHSAATAGACAGPLLIHGLAAGSHWTESFHALGVVHVGLAVWGWSAPWTRRQGETAQPVSTTPVGLGALATPALFALAVIAFAYVGVENGLTLFTVPWSESRGLSAEGGQTGISAFWLGLLLGRLALVMQQGTRGAQLLTACGLGGALLVCGASALPVAPLTWALWTTGLALGPVYPVMIALAAQRFPQAMGSAMGLVAGAGAAGGFVVPWLSGAVGDALGVRATITSLAACSLLISMAALGLARHDATRSRVLRVSPSVDA